MHHPVERHSRMRVSRKRLVAACSTPRLALCGFLIGTGLTMAVSAMLSFPRAGEGQEAMVAQSEPHHDAVRPAIAAGVGVPKGHVLLGEATVRGTRSAAQLLASTPPPETDEDLCTDQVVDVNIDGQGQLGSTKPSLEVQEMDRVARVLRRDGTELHGRVRDSEMQFFHVCVGRARASRRVVVTLRVNATKPAPGDADLYLSTSNPYPTPESSTWISAHIGGDTISLSTQHRDWTPGSYMLYVGVYGRGGGHAGTTFSVRAEVRQEPPEPASRLVSSLRGGRQ